MRHSFHFNADTVQPRKENTLLQPRARHHHDSQKTLPCPVPSPHHWQLRHLTFFPSSFNKLEVNTPEGKEILAFKRTKKKHEKRGGIAGWYAKALQKFAPQGNHKPVQPYTLREPKDGPVNTGQLKHAPMHVETIIQTLGFYGKALAFLFSLNTQAYEKKREAFRPLWFLEPSKDTFNAKKTVSI